METYEALSHFAQGWGLIYFIALFLGAVGYTLWPRNLKRFDAAAKIPLRED